MVGMRLKDNFWSWFSFSTFTTTRLKQQVLLPIESSWLVLTYKIKCKDSVWYLGSIHFLLL